MNMQIVQRMVADMLSRGEVMLSLSKETMDYVEKRCFVLLERIRQILADDTLDDPECFQRIEEIVSLLESNGIDCGTRHDFG